MPLYQYRGLQYDGEATVGVVDAESVREARQKLRGDGIYPVSVVDQEAGSRACDTGPAAPRLRRRLPARDLALLSRQLSVLLNAGLPVVDALTILLGQVDGPAIRGFLADVRESLRQGLRLSHAMAATGHCVPPIYVQMIRAGEASGNLEAVLQRLADFFDHQAKIRNSIIGALTYPAVIAVVGAAVLIFVLTSVVPQIAAIFADLQQALPWPTVAVMTAGDILSTWWPAFVIGLAAAGLAARRALAVPGVRTAADRWLLRVPMIGALSRTVAMARFSRTTATLLMGGVQLLDALDLARPVLGNRVLEEAMSRVREKVREGQSFARALTEARCFPPLMISLVQVGEQSGDLDAMLARTAQIYDGEAEALVGRLTTMLEPAMIVVMGGVVCFIVVAILLPLIDMTQHVR